MPSRPTTEGSGGLVGRPPAAVKRSIGFRPATATSTMPSPSASGASNVSGSGGRSWAVRTAARTRHRLARVPPPRLPAHVAPPPPPRLPEHVAALASELAGLPGAHAVVLGGSRATATHRPDSDWDLGLYYRASVRSLDPADVRALGHPGQVSELGEWGPIVDGGAWLTIDGTPVDVLFGDLDTVERWADDAEHGRFEVLAQNGSVVGAPTYLPVGALALCVPLAGELPRPAYSEALSASASERWRGRAAVALMFAALHAQTADAVCCAGRLARGGPGARRA